MTSTRIIKIGNSQGIILPSEIIKALALEEADPVEIVFDPATQHLSLHFPSTKQLKLTANHN